MDNATIKEKLAAVVSEAVSVIGHRETDAEIRLILDKFNSDIKTNAACDICKKRSIGKVIFNDGFSLLSCSNCNHDILRYDGFARTVRHQKGGSGFIVHIRCYDHKGNERLLDLRARHRVELKSKDVFSLEYTRIKNIYGDELFSVSFRNFTIDKECFFEADIDEGKRLLKGVTLKKGSDLVKVRKELDKKFVDEQEVLKLRKENEPIILDLAAKVLENSVDHVEAIEGIAKAYAKIKRRANRRGRLAYTKLVFGKLVDENEASQICQKIIKQGSARSN